MKLLLPFLLPLAFVACSTPKVVDDGESHQRRLAKEARENFYALKAEERKRNPPPAPVASAPPQRVCEKPEAPAMSPFYQEERRWFGWFGKPRRNDETVYETPAQRRGELNATRLRAAEARYARELAKSPEDLTSEELLWARTRYY